MNMSETAPLKIAVLLSPAQHAVSGHPLRSSSDAAAFELACSLAPEQRLTILCAGMVSKESLNDYLGLGASAIEVLTVEQGADVVAALQARLQGFDIVLCGVRSDGQSGSGLLPYLLAEGLQMPLVADVLEAKFQTKGLQAQLQLRQFLPKGMRRRLEVSLPVLLTVHARAPQTRQYAYARARSGRISYVAGKHQSNGTNDTPSQAWNIEPALRRPRPLKAKIVQSGHSRMLGAIGGDTEVRASVVLKEGSAEQKAQALLAYLREHHLVDY
ncbi:electron transfer flavoprotein subunit beta/FixA family protein [Solimicrobium silvestre]|nr:electron transfer flavoprotein subunit beta/FixA family protein [Solimicrobium silvestre]